VSDCGVCLSGFDGYSEFCHTQIRKARKAHRCSECDKEILPGERYERATGKSEGELWDADTCLICAEIAKAFYCEGRWFGGMLWESMYEVFPEMTTGCLERLQTAAAKTELIRRWNEWKFESST
jgi:hypothetical protein